MPHSLFASSAFTRTILDHAEQSGLCSQTLLERAGICPTTLESQAHRIPALAVEQLWRECEQAGVGATFGCELVNGLGTTCLQGLNILLDSAATLRASLNCFVMFAPRITNYVAVELQETGAFAHVHLRPVHEQAHHFALDAVTITLVRNISRRLGKAPEQVFAGVNLCPPQAAKAWLRDAGISVGQGEHPHLTIHRSNLDDTLLGANPFLHQSMLRHWQAQSCALNRSDSLELARHWLTAGDQPIERIAERLGYRQPSNFIRAFRKQFGITPKQFRLKPT